MNRNITNKINYLLDNWISPRIRDSEIFMSIIMRMAIGNKYRYYMEFKKKFPGLSQEEINSYYSILADTFIKRKTDLNKQCVDLILKNYVGDRILDVAAGKGYLAEKIVKNSTKNIKVMALDVVVPNRYKRLNGVEWVCGSITKLPFPDNSFDTVICTHALEHIKDVGSALSELRRVCNKRLIIVIPCQKEYIYTVDLHVNFYPYKYNVERLFCNPKVHVKLVNGDWLCIENL